ncbi:hypothetical protein M438DRAFT_360539 [Aureobasidium pullulans EXF-150]|uniref:Methyltransferase fungal type helix-turn-helix domain-containing protein n=1 Tax=Aureobasidium pullulans EXF-150 TaxID=1043002 RepID=A0A074WYV8_AURPU|nr:uncharacterized protein M438DRAFT_360539 [Aureobasidium pullulans EXF-150]KEQ78405.1 hypothetical protein M438DRAFT_360539 [Aureobasidium pullulans EXF-150]
MVLRMIAVLALVPPASGLIHESILQPLYRREVRLSTIVDYKIANFVDVILAKSTQLCVALVVEAFDKLGCPINAFVTGQEVQRITYQSWHEKLVDYLYKLQDKEARLLNIEESRITRSAIAYPTESSDALLQNLLRDHPKWTFASNLTHFAGKHLSEVLTGKIDGIIVISANRQRRDPVSEFYCEHSFNKMPYHQMQDFIGRLVSLIWMEDGPLKILEMGAGTGGTTCVLVPFLASLGIPLEYTFTDISPSMVAQAKKEVPISLHENFP